MIIILFLAAIITPTTDMFTLILMAGPMYLLYEGCILIAWVDGKEGSPSIPGREFDPRISIEMRGNLRRKGFAEFVELAFSHPKDYRVHRFLGCRISARHFA